MCDPKKYFRLVNVRLFARYSFEHKAWHVGVRAHGEGGDTQATAYLNEDQFRALLDAVRKPFEGKFEPIPSEQEFKL